jgi:hypothetical protein
LQGLSKGGVHLKKKRVSPMVIIMFILLIGGLMFLGMNQIKISKAMKSQGMLVNEQHKLIMELQEVIAEFRNPKNGVNYNGQLAVDGAQLINSAGSPIQLRGMSSHGIMWYPEFTNYRAIATTKQFGANVFRIAMYIDQEKGYVYNPKESKLALYMALENTLGADMYAIVDWHVLRDENPLKYVREAVNFFEEVSSRYADEPGVIYEICNEPNGETSWADIKLYSDQVIPVIRNHSPNAVILVGTPNYSSDIKKAVDDPLSYDNIMYTYHFYTGYSGDGFKSNLRYALENNTPVFVTEWGLNYDPGTTIINYNRAEEFLTLLNDYKISWVNWSLCNKDEVYSAISPSDTRISGWSIDELTETGEFIFKALSLE